MWISSLLFPLQEYLTRLRAIRQQNYQERKRIQLRRDNNQGILDPPPPSALPLQLDPDERRRKIAALKVMVFLRLLCFLKQPVL